MLLANISHARQERRPALVMAGARIMKLRHALARRKAKCLLEPRGDELAASIGYCGGTRRYSHACAPLAALNMKRWLE